MPLLYEVRLDPHPQRADEVAAYMTGVHIPAIMATGCFLGARFARLEGEVPVFRTTYVAGTPDDLARYLRDFSPRFRAEFTRDLGDAATASRAVWVEVRAFGDVY